MKYSPSTKTYYMPGFQFTNAPDDLVDVTYEQWQAAVGKPIDDAPAVPQWVPMYQGRAALIMAGLDDAVEDFIASMPDGVQKKLVQNAWNKAETIRRDSEFTQMLATALGLTDTQLDDLFIAAAQVQ